MLFTDASQRFGAKQHGTFDASVLDILEHSCTGRVLEFDPSTRATRVLIGGLCFPNGVALSADQSHYFIAETGEYRIWKVARGAEPMDARAAAGNDPRAQVILANLPGFPDNLTRGEDGRLWTGFTKPRSNLIDRMSDKPALRAITCGCRSSSGRCRRPTATSSRSTSRAAWWPTCRTRRARCRRRAAPPSTAAASTCRACTRRRWA